MTPNGGPARLLRVYGWWILLITVVVMAAGYGVSLLAPTNYSSAAIVVVQARVAANTNVVPPDMGTEKELAHSGLVLNPAGTTTGVDPGTLAKGLSVTVATDANILSFNYTDKDPAAAKYLAHELAQAYVDYHNEKTDNSTAQVDAQIVTDSYLPGTPNARPTWIDMGVGFVLGLLLGIGTAVIRDRLSDRVRGRADLEQLTGVPVLATVPRVRKVTGPVLLRAPESAAAEAYRYLRTRLQPLLARDGASILLITSAGEKEGRSMTAANLALSLAAAGRNVILVDADLRGPVQHTLLEVAGDRGLTGLLTGDTTPDEALQDGPVPRLKVVAAGPGADGATDLLEGPRLARVLKGLRRLCDVVVLDSAAVLSVSDAIALASVSDHVLFVADYRRTTRANVTRALAELAEVTEGNASAVLLNAPKSAGGLVPHARGTQPATAPDEPLSLLDAGADDRPRAAVGSAAVPKSFAPAQATTTVYSSSMAVKDTSVDDAPVAGKKPAPPVIAGGPVKQRANGTPVPGPRAEND